MKNKTKYTKGPEGDLRIVDDFLPAPDALVLKEDNIKITIALNRSSVEFFKKVAKEHNISYQKLIRQVIDRYALHYRDSA